MSQASADPREDAPREDSRQRREPQRGESSSSQQSSKRRWVHDVKRAGVGGVIALAFAAVTGAVVGTAGPWKAEEIVESVTAVLPYFGSAAMGAGSTILALMLTLLGVGQSAQTRFSQTFYKRIVWIGRQACLVFAGAALLLLAMAAPVQKLEEGDGTLLVVQFYVIAGSLALLAGLLTSTLMMLQSTLEDLVKVLGIGLEEHPMIADSGNS